MKVIKAVVNEAVAVLDLKKVLTCVTELVDKSAGKNNVLLTELDVTIKVVVTGLLEGKGVGGVSKDLGKVITPLQL